MAGLLNRFLEMPPGIVTVLSGYRNHFGKLPIPSQSGPKKKTL
jgi:hypothetical protein